MKTCKQMSINLAISFFAYLNFCYVPHHIASEHHADTHVHNSITHSHGHSHGHFSNSKDAPSDQEPHDHDSSDHEAVSFFNKKQDTDSFFGQFASLIPIAGLNLQQVQARPTKLDFKNALFGQDPRCQANPRAPPFYLI